MASHSASYCSFISASAGDSSSRTCLFTRRGEREREREREREKKKKKKKNGDVR